MQELILHVPYPPLLFCLVEFDGGGSGYLDLSNFMKGYLLRI